MGKHKKHKKHHSHPHGHGSKDMSAYAPDLKVVVPLQSLVETASPEPVSTPQSQLTVSIPRTAMYPPQTHQPHSSHHHTPHSSHTHASSEHKHHKKHKKKHKKHHEGTHDLHVSEPKISPLRLPLPKPDPPHAPLITDSAHTHTPHTSHSKHHKHKHKRSRDSMEDHGSAAVSEAGQPKIKRPKISGLQLEDQPVVEPKKRLVTPLQIHLPPEAHNEHKHKKKKKKHKHSKTSSDEHSWEVVKEPPPPAETPSLATPTPATPVTSDPKTTPLRVDRPPVQSSPGKQMRLLRGLEASMKEKAKQTTPAGRVSEKVTRRASVKKEVAVEVETLVPPVPAAPVVVKSKTPQVKLSENALKFFLKNLHHLIQKRDPEGVFSEPVTDDIAPNYSTIITHPMDLTTMANKIESNQYPSINEFKADFELMCSNAMIYNAPETAYYSLAKHLLNMGLQIITKETSMRPDILHGRLASALDRAHSASPLPPSLTTHVPPSTNCRVDLSSPFLCRVPLSQLRGPPDENIDVSGLGEIKDQSHLTKVVVGVECESVEPVEGSEDEVLDQVMDTAEAVMENLEVKQPDSKFCFLNRDENGKTILNIMDPESSNVDYRKPIDLSELSNRVRMGTNAATVLKTELPMMKATPVSYLMYGPFGSFAPSYDSAFASLAKVDSEMLLNTYGNELGVSYAHSLQQFVKGTGSFVSEMADAVLNGLTNHRHSKFVEKMKEINGKDMKPQDKESETNEVKSPKKEKYEPDTEAMDTTEGQSPSENSTEPKTEASPKPETPSTTEQEAKPPIEDAQDNTESSSSIDKTHDATSNEDSKPFPVDSEITPSVEDDSRPSFSVEELVSETSPFPPVEDNQAFFPDPQLESCDTSPISSANSGSGVPSERDSRSSSREESGEGASSTDRSRSTSVSEPGRESRDSNISTGFNEGSPTTEDTVDSRLQRTSDLLAELQEHQNIRLSLPPESSDTGQVLLSGPSQAELDTAVQVRGELASLTAKVQPGDLVTVNSLHKAMGITEKDNVEEPAVEEPMNSEGS